MKNTALSHSQAVGFNDDVHNLFSQETPALKTAGLPAEKMLTTMETLQRKVGEMNAKQEDLKRELKETTKQYNSLKREMYATASGYLDMAIAAVDKRSDAAKNFRRLRSRVTRPGIGPSDAQTPDKTTQKPTPELTS